MAVKKWLRLLRGHTPRLGLEASTHPCPPQAGYRKVTV
jgi:hypothetical protein